jgi:porin
LTDLALTVDLKPYFNAPGTVFARAYQIHGRGLTANNIGNLGPVSGIEATRTTRLFELWYEAQLVDGVQLRLGQQAAGTEFQISTAAQLFVNATFGWPNLPAIALPAGGPTYPLGTPGLRLKATPNDELMLLLGVYNGNPAGPGAGDPQLRDASGTAFRINDGAFVIAEAQYHPGNSDRTGTYRLGGWFNSERFPDQQFDTTGTSLANPASNGTPRQHRRNAGIYGIVDQPVLRGEDDEGGATVFARVMGAPSDRNLVDFYIDGGIAYAGPFGRKDDRVGIGIGYTRIGAAARGLDADIAGFSGQPFPVRSAEIVVEVTYRLQLAPWWQLQPDFQYVINPGGGILNPNRPGQRLGDAAVFGLRTAVTF